MKKTDIGLFDLFLQLRTIAFEFITKLLHYIAGTTNRRSPVITMLGNFMTSPCHYKTSKRRNIEGILSIAASTNNVDCFIAIEINLYAYLQKGVAETLQLFDGDTSHQENRNEGCHFMFAVHTFWNIGQYFFSLLARQGFMFKTELKDVVYICLRNVLW